MSASLRSAYRIVPPIAFAAIILLTGSALADAIDGNWCNKVGKSLHIDGPAITTPGGAQITGNYDRHNFSYISPDGEDHAGKMISMSQQSEEHMTMQLPNGKTEPWSRCEVVS